MHGRFQPPLHVNHWAYIENGFNQADHVTVLVTNPYKDEAFDEAASWRNDPANNPFTYDERVAMFEDFFTAMGISPKRYEFKPFNIKDDTAFAELDPSVPNLVNVYSEWSAKKVAAFEDHGLKVIRLDMPKSRPVSGTLLREIITNCENRTKLPEQLAAAGLMPQAVHGLMQMLSDRDIKAKP